MRILKSTLFIALNFLLVSGLKSQHVEVGLMLGASNYLGDLSNETFLMQETKFAASIYGRYNFLPRFAAKGFIGYGRLSGDDNNFKDVTRSYAGVEDFKFNYFRNLNFNTDIYEASIHAEYNLLKNDLNTYQTRPFIPYVFAGIGLFHFNPKSTFQGKEVELQPLGTEGQGSTTYNDIKKYSLTSFCIPVGLGFRQKIGDDFFVGVEAGLRFTTTNYIDDVGGLYGSNSVIFGATGATGLLMADRSWERPEVNPNPTLDEPIRNVFAFQESMKRSDKQNFQNDMYFMAGITISYVIRFRGQGCPQF